MRGEITGLHRRLGATMIYVTHDQVEAMTMADKIVVLRAGNIEQVGTPLDLYNRPDNKFVAGFIGSPQMNFIAGHSGAWRQHRDRPRRDLCNAYQQARIGHRTHARRSSGTLDPLRPHKAQSRCQ